MHSANGAEPRGRIERLSEVTRETVCLEARRMKELHEPTASILGGAWQDLEASRKASRRKADRELRCVLVSGRSLNAGGLPSTDAHAYVVGVATRRRGVRWQGLESTERPT
jgi:hypothetical protein